MNHNPLITPAPGTHYPRLAMHGDPDNPQGVELRVVGVAYGPATNHGRRYAAYTQGSAIHRYHADMHIDAYDPCDPTSPHNWS